jgi:competence protein ComEC
MGASRFGLPVALAGVAIGILIASVVAVPLVPLLMAGTTATVIGSLIGGRTAFVALAGLGLAFVAVGTWRGASSDAMVGGPGSVANLVDGAEHTVSGTVVDDPRPREDRLQLVLDDVVLEGADGAARALDDRLLVWLPRGIDAAAGDRLRVASEVELAEDFDGFAYRAYLQRQGIAAIARARSAEVLSGGSGGVSAALAGVRGALLHGLNRLIPEPEAALGAGILLGVRASIAPEINDAFATAGLTHVVAISGWNIAIVAAIVAALVHPLARRPSGRWTTAIVASATVAGYVLLTGASPSVVRAALMAGAMLLGRFGGSRAHAASALELAALVMLLAAPPVLWDVGFQLSLLATAGLIWFGASVERRLPRWPPWIREPMALTLAAQLTTLPVVLVNFERLSLVAPIANVLVVPFVPVAMLFSAVASVVGMVDAALHPPILGTALNGFAGGAAWLVLRVIVSLGTAVASVPYAALPVEMPPAFAVAWFPILALGTWALRPPEHVAKEAAAVAEPGPIARLASQVLRPLPMTGALLAVLLVITVAARPDGRLHVTALDIGQGDAILLETPSGATMLIDGGPDPELTLRRLGANLPFFARRLDVLLLTHPHQDHVAGLVEALDRFEVGTVIHAGIAFENAAYDRLLADASAAEIPVGIAREGQVLALDATTSVRVLYPSAADASAPLPEDDINNGSVVIELTYGGFRALLTGDAETPVEELLEQRNLLEPLDLLKVGHHGSRTSTTPSFLDAVRPAVAMISVGTGNEYGHPAPETLAALAALPGLATYRTDLDGDIELETDGRTLRVHTDAGWSDARAVHGSHPTGSLLRWPCPTDPPPFASWPMPACPMGSSSIPAAWLASPSRPPASWRRRRSRSTARWSRRRHSCTTSTRSRSAARAESMAWWARDASRRWATTSWPCRSPPTRSQHSSTTTATPSAGRRSSLPLPTSTWGRRS